MRVSRVDGVAYEVDPDVAGETVICGGGCLTKSCTSNTVTRRYGPYTGGRSDPTASVSAFQENRL